MDDVIEAFERHFNDIVLRIISNAKDGNLLGDDLVPYRKTRDLNFCPLSL